MPRNKARAVALRISRPSIWAAGLLGGSAALYLSAMAPRLIAEAMFGPICSGHAAFAPHCPACYAATALAGLGLAAATLAAARLGRRER